MRVGIIGTGFGATKMAPAYAATSGCEVVAVISARDEAAVAELCRRKDVDLVSVHSPPFLHVEHVHAALDGGKHVVCDKPFGLSADQAVAMRTAAESAGVHHLVNFEFRGDPWRLAARELVQSGVLGNLDHVSWRQIGSANRAPSSGWRSDPHRGGGWLGSSVCHALDSLGWIVGGSVGFVAGALSARGADVAEDGCVLSVHVGEAVQGSVVAVSTAARNLPLAVVLSGEQAALELSGTGLALVGAEWPGGIARPEPPSAPVDSLVSRWCARVCDLVDHEMQDADDPLPTFDDGVRCAELLEQIRASSVWARSSRERTL